MPILTEIAGQPVFRIEDNPGIYWDDVIRAATSLNDLPVRVFKDRVDALGGVFSNREIKVAIALGHIVCDPYPESIAGSSVDVRLGHQYFSTGFDDEGSISLYNPHSERSVGAYFGKVREAEPVDEVISFLGRRGVELSHAYNLEGYPTDHPVILLAPHERILGHTVEFIGIQAPGTTSMQSRSTTGRNGEATCFCAGWGDPGFTGRWTMEVYNLNRHAYVAIPENYRVAQVAFFSTGPVEGKYAELTGKYQPSDVGSQEGLKATWHPDLMKPKAFKDPLYPPVEVTGLDERYR